MPKLQEKKLIDELADALFHGRLREVVIDSRAIRPGDIFVALPGTKVHGNEFIPAALAAGAELAIADERTPHPSHRKVYPAADPAGFLSTLAAAVRSLSPATRIGITGSNGKTTTKELLHCVLGRNTLKTEGNLNNQLGVPLTLCRLKERHRFAVIELGTSNPGEIASLMSLVRPHCGVLTSIGPVHLEGLGSVSGVAEEKSSIFKGLEDPGWCFAAGPTCRHEEVRAALKERPHVTFGLEREDIRPTAMSFRSGLVGWKWQDTNFLLSSPARHNIQNAMAAIAVASRFGVPPATLAERLRVWQPPKHRMNLLRWRQRKILDDCYNANPASMRSAAETAVALRQRPTQRIFAALGDMKELGVRSCSMHRQLGNHLASLGIDVLLTLGDHMRRALAGFESSGGSCSRHCEDARDMGDFLLNYSRPHDIILVKGSRSMHMEEVLDEFGPALEPITAAS